MFRRHRRGSRPSRRNQSVRPSLSRKRCPRFEPLEDRRLLAITWNIMPIAAGTVVGDGVDNMPGNSDDEVTIAMPAAALAAFNEATRIFDQYITDAVTVNLQVGWGINFSPNTNAFANSFSISDTFTNVRNRLQADQTSIADATAFSSLPGAADFDVYINRTNNNPNGAGSATPYLDNDADANNTTVQIRRANAKALGLLGANNAGVDGRIVFNSTRMWDLSRADGVTGFDFTGIAAHEIGHFLGFSSGVDTLDFDNTANGQPGRNDDGFNVATVLDLFRFSAESIAAGGAGTVDFTADARTKYFSIDGGTTQLGALGEGENNGSPANQASHWLDLTPEIGIMDPTTNQGELDILTPLDLTAFDVIGWDINAAALSATPTLQGTDTDDTFVVRLNPADTTRVQVQLNGAIIATYGVADIDQLTIEGLGGNDKLIVDSTSGLIGIATAIVFDGGTGHDTLQLNQTGGTKWTSETLTVGATPGSGIDTIIGGGITQVVRFQNLEPIISNVPAVTLVVNGATIGSFLNGANQITYDESDLFGGSWGRVTIDAFEPVHFINKDNLLIDAENGDDTIVLNNPLLPTALQRITVNAEAGNDQVRLEDLPATAGTFAGVTVDGGTGNDLIDAGAIASITALILRGGAGNDTIVGDVGLDGAGEGVDTYDGGAGTDTFVVRGSDLDDVIDVFQQAASTTVGANYQLGVVNLPLTAILTPTTENITTTNIAQAPSNAANRPTIERIVMSALGGDDFLRAGHSDSYANPAVPGDAVHTIRIDVEGDAPNASDVLGVRDDGVGDLVIQRLGADQRSGSFVVGGMAPINYSGVEFANVVPLNQITGGTGTDGLGRLVVFKNDPYETNNSLVSATHLGAGPTINTDPTIDPGGFPPLDIPGDSDFYRFVAQETGTLDFQLYFRPIGTLANGRPGLPQAGELQATFFDDDGLPISIGVSSAQPILDGSGNKIGERITMPVVRNQVYYVRIEGDPVPPTVGGGAINVYNFTAITTPAPIPQLVDLQAASDSGRHNSDDITRITTPTFDIILDDDRIDEFANINLNPDTVNDDLPTLTDAGGNRIDYGVEVFNNAVSIGFAFYTGVGNTWRFTATAGDLNEGSNNFISAGVWIRDRADPTRLGRHELSVPLHVTLDTIAPPVSFGLPDAASERDGLAASSDTGVTTMPATYADRITSDTTPTLWGRAEANSIVRVYLDRDYDGIIDLNTDTFLGQTVALPYDGNDAYPNGYWELTSALDLNEILGPPNDGLRRLLVTAEDVAGNPPITFGPAEQPQLTAGDELQIFIDTQGPQVTNLTIGSFPNFDLFDPKPTTNGYTPLVDRLQINFRDLPSRVDQINALNDFLYEALKADIAGTLGNYVLVGDHVGVIPIASILVANENAADYTFNGALTTVTSAQVVRNGNFVGALEQPVVGDYITFTNGPAVGQVRRIVAYNSLSGEMTFDVPLLNLPAVGNTFTITTFAEAVVTLNFTSPLPDDRYTLTIRDNLVDPAGNRLDGESNAAEPLDNPFFPSGDGVPGGNFVARFTVDSRPEIGSYVSQDIDIDINGNFVWDPANGQIGNDATNVDISWTLPVQNASGTVAPGGFNVHDLLFAGKFRRNIETDGGPQQAVVLGPLFFDQLAAFGNAADLGGVFRWIIDTNSDGVVTLGTDIRTVQPLLGNFNVQGAIPVAGNFDGNLNNGDEIGLYNSGKWGLDFNRDFVIQANEVISTTLFGRPIVGDFDGDGLEDLAVFNNNVFYFNLANDGLGDAVDRQMVWGFPGVLDQPVAADMDQDGIDDIGLWVPRNSATQPGALTEWYFLVSNDPSGELRVPGTINRLNHAFTPTPFGKDLYAEFGDDRAQPIVGNFDPPVARPAAAPPQLAGDYDSNGRVEQADYTVWRSNFGSRTNLAADGNRDGVVDASDYTVWRNNLGAVAAAATAGGGATAGDYNGSGQVTSADFTSWSSGFGSTTTLASDGNENGKVDAADYTLWRDNLGATAAGGGSGALLATAVAASEVTTDSVAYVDWMLPANDDKDVEEVYALATPASMGDKSLLLVLDQGGKSAVDEAFTAWLESSGDEGADEAGAPALAVAWQNWGEL